MSLFGTDGVRGEAGVFPLLPHNLTGLGYQIGKTSKGPVVVGRDSRASGPWMTDALAAGIASAGQDVFDLAMVPTAVVARVTARLNKGMGVVLSASHNPARDNGVKVLRSDGTKSTPAMEKQFEKAMLHPPEKVDSLGGSRHQRPDLIDEDVEWIFNRFNRLDLKGLKIVIDTAHGAATHLVPLILDELGARVIQIGGQPNGKNINLRCGSMHLEGLRRRVKKEKADLGLAFDGDADRLMGVGPDGSVLDGDHLLALLLESPWIRQAKTKTLVGTLMTNEAMKDFCRERGFRLVRTPVGDKYVVAKMKKSGAPLGGENSGHIIMAKLGFVGDGLVTALAVLEALKGRHPNEVFGEYRHWPQVLINIPVGQKTPFEKKKKITHGVKHCEKALKGKGRVLLRYSGTENLARVMVEGQDGEIVQREARALATIVATELRGELNEAWHQH